MESGRKMIIGVKFEVWISPNKEEKSGSVVSMGILMEFSQQSLDY